MGRWGKRPNVSCPPELHSSNSKENTKCQLVHPSANPNAISFSSSVPPPPFLASLRIPLCFCRFLSGAFASSSLESINGGGSYKRLLSVGTSMFAERTNYCLVDPSLLSTDVSSDGGMTPPAQPAQRQLLTHSWLVLAFYWRLLTSFVPILYPCLI